MKTLVVGFDSAWTPTNAGALVGAVVQTDGRVRALGPPRPADFPAAEQAIQAWRDAEGVDATLILLDQPTIVPNETGQRPVENIVAGPVSRRFGGVQPANRGRAEMFGDDAPVWPFLARFGGAAPLDGLRPGRRAAQVFETYPVLALIALRWTRPDERRATGRLPKYNPERRKTFRLADWQYVCTVAARFVSEVGLSELAEELHRLGALERPRKRDQDGLDACLCLVVGLHLALGRSGLAVGQAESGYIVVPYGDVLADELTDRCVATRRDPEAWVRRFRLETGAG
ncbi:MAG: DUF429 domain-containing protein [Bacteroidota bacterium]